GGSLANIKITMDERDNIRDNTLAEYFKYKPDYLVTSCPLCKKTFSKGRDIRVFDIAEIVARSLPDQDHKRAGTGILAGEILQDKSC
ncbi:MAG TPA: hypothetical protein VI583_01200, partial [Cyclobacteriaceae bacterium]|nr:hypothetical protein [Cyclobacteriaceae bacterium]